jgi:D-psicose/D-tagatose/L-ribulose 3-epimerase
LIPGPFRHAICNEVFERWRFAGACHGARQAGYGGIEIAPFTLADDAAAITPDCRREYRNIMQSEGIEFVGLHWLLASPPDLHVTTPDESLRRRSWQHIRSLIDLCADLGDDGVMVFGSPKQRGASGGATRDEATGRLIEGLASIAPHAAERGVTILIEALPRAQCDVVNTLDEAASVVEQVNHPALRTMFDSHNAADETEPHASLVERYYPLIRHVHVNEMDGTYPRPGGYDFKPVFDVLRHHRYPGWISLEVFDFTPAVETIARESLRYLESEIGRLPE